MPPATPPATTADGPARRTVLGALAAASAVLGLTACRLRVGQPSRARPAGAPSGVPASQVERADQAALATAAQSALRLDDLYAQAVAVRPDLAGPLARLAADHSAHLRALDLLGASPIPTATATPTTTITSAPMTTTNAVSVLAQAERSAGTTGSAELAAVDGRTARLLASIAASSSVHVALLARLPATPVKAPAG